MEVHTEGFFFGPEARLLGLHTAPAGGRSRGSVLVCPSLFSDTTRSQWVVRSLAHRLAREGFHVLRFDFSGMEGSTGNAASRTPGQWAEDLAAAVAEAKARSGRPLRAVLAIRAGALVWGNAAGLPAVDRFVAWDPFPSGGALLRAMRELQDVYEQRTPVPDPSPALGGLGVDPRVAVQLEAMEGPLIDASRRLLLCSNGAEPADLPDRWEMVRLEGVYDWTTWELHVLHAQEVIERTVEILG